MPAYLFKDDEGHYKVRRSQSMIDMPRWEGKYGPIYHPKPRAEVPYKRTHDDITAYMIGRSRGPGSMRFRTDWDMHHQMQEKFYPAGIDKYSTYNPPKAWEDRHDYRAVRCHWPCHHHSYLPHRRYYLFEQTHMPLWFYSTRWRTPHYEDRWHYVGYPDTQAWRRNIYEHIPSYYESRYGIVGRYR